MSQSVKQVEYSIEDLPMLLNQLEQLKADMNALQRWRRRTISALRKVSAATSFLKFHLRSDTAKVELSDKEQQEQAEACKALIQDFEHIANAIADFGRRLENTLPIIPTLIQLTEGRLSLRETEYVRRLTHLALVFVPLSFTAAIFSMNTPYAPGGSDFWVYVVVSLPITLVVFGIARLSEFNGGMSHIWAALGSRIHAAN
ncbi:Mg2+ transporter protein CorA-like/Zinc transport protein ZntB [Lasiodiplodia theobromae]|nr:Mg2+ transporter protein CorA-like/Zinc transport protein ZntB [Lasiodiplodia theobromae]